MFRGRRGGEPVVLADEERLQRGEFGIFIGPHVAGQEQLVVGDHVGVVGVDQSGGVEGEEIARARLQPAAGELPQGGRPRGIDAVDLRAVDEGRQRVHLLPRSAGGGASGGGASGGIVGRPRQGNRHGACARRIERRISRRHGDGKPFAGRGGFGEAQVVVEKLAPGIDERREIPVVGDAAFRALKQRVADGPGVGPVGARGCAHAVGIGGRRLPQ